MKALVTGASGFVGKHLIQALLERGHEVTGISRSDPLIHNKLFSFQEIDITSEESVLTLEKSFDVVFHTAAYIPLKMEESEAKKCFTVNTKGTMHILSHCQKNGVRHIVHSSTASVYGTPEEVPVNEEFQTHPENVYAISKLASEHVCHMFSRLHNLKISILRYSSIYGRGMATNTVLPFFAEKIKAGKGITLFGKGKRSQDFVSVHDVVSANILAGMKHEIGIFNIGGGQEVTMKKLAETLIKILKSSSKIMYEPSIEEKFRMFLDITKARKELKYIPSYSLEQGLQEFLKLI